MFHQFFVRPLELDSVDKWLMIHQSVYSQYPWPKSIERSDVVKLVSSQETHPMIAFTEKGPFGIAILEIEPDSHRLTLNDLACYKASNELVKTFLHYIINQAREMGAISINVWMWDSEKQMLDVLIDAGFIIEVEHSLISRDVSEISNSHSQNLLVIHSLSEGVTIPDFVRANREAFKDDPSEPLEESELEGWISDAEGFHPSLQLAALVNDSIVGTTMCEIFTLERSTGDERHAWIHGLGVVNDYRQRGIATSLVDELILRLKEFHVNKLWLFTDTEGLIREFYDRLCFFQQVNWVDLTLYFKPKS